MIYYYHWSYDEKQDQFFAFVDDGTRAGQIVFQIDDTPEVCQYIKSGKMSHIDDVEGLEEFLKEQAIIKGEDTLIFQEEQVW